MKKILDANDPFFKPVWRRWARQLSREWAAIAVSVSGRGGGLARSNAATSIITASRSGAWNRIKRSVLPLQFGNPAQACKNNDGPPVASTTSK